MSPDPKTKHRGLAARAACSWVAPITNSGTLRLAYAFNTNFTTNLNFAMYYSSGAFNVSVVDSGGGDPATVEVEQATTANTFYNVTMTYNASDKKARLYINGVIGGTSSALTNGVKQTNYIRWGRSSTGTDYGEHKDGVECIFNKALSDDEVKLLYNANCKAFGLNKI